MDDSEFDVVFGRDSGLEFEAGFIGVVDICSMDSRSLPVPRL